jgi:hypothetical protein
MNGNYAFMEFYTNERVANSLAEASNERRIPRGKREPPLFIYLFSLVALITSAILIF